MKKLWVLAFRNLLRNRRRTIATGIAIVFGYAGLVLVSAYIFRAYMGLRTSSIYLNHRGHIAVMIKDAQDEFAGRPKKYVMKPEDVIRVRQALEPWGKSVEFTASFLSGMGLLIQGPKSAPVAMTGVEPDAYPLLLDHPEMRRWSRDYGRRFTGEDLTWFQRDGKMISLTEALAMTIGKSPPLTRYKGDDAEAQLVAKTYDGDLGAVDVHLGMEHTTGVKFIEHTSVLLPIRLLQSVLGTDGIENLTVFLRHPGETATIATDLRRKLGDHFDVVTYADESWNPFFVGTMNFLYVMAGFFIVLILGAVALTLANTTTLNLLERTREIGTIRAIGFPPSKLKALFRRESTLLSLFCVGLGWIVAAIIATVVNSMNIRFHPPGTQGDIQFLLMIHPAFAATMAVLVFVVTWIATETVVRKKSREKIVLLLAETGA